MSFLPDITDDGEIEEKPLPKLYTPPRTFQIRKEEEKLADLNNLGREEVSQDFSDSPVFEK